MEIISKNLLSVLAFSEKYDTINSDGRLAQLGERSLDVRKVAGSSPVPSIFFA